MWGADWGYGCGMKNAECGCRCGFGMRMRMRIENGQAFRVSMNSTRVSLAFTKVIRSYVSFEIQTSGSKNLAGIRPMNDSVNIKFLVLLYNFQLLNNLKLFFTIFPFWNAQQLERKQISWGLLTTISVLRRFFVLLHYIVC